MADTAQWDEPKARGKLGILPGPVGRWTGQGQKGRKIYTRGEAEELLRRGDISQSNFDKVAHILPETKKA